MKNKQFGQDMITRSSLYALLFIICGSGITAMEKKIPLRKNMTTRSSLYALLFIIGGNGITAMEKEVPQNTQLNQQTSPPQNFRFTDNFERALQKRLQCNPKDNIIHRYQHDDNPYHDAAKAIESFSQKVNPSKSYILLCENIQNPDQNIFHCDMFAVSNREWIQGLKIEAHRDKDIEMFVPIAYSNEDGSEFYPLSCTPDMNDSSFAIINMHDLNMPPYLCGKLAQGLKARGIPVIFNIRQDLSDDLFSLDPETGAPNPALSLLLKEPESYKADNQQEEPYNLTNEKDRKITQVSKQETPTSKDTQEKTTLTQPQPKNNNWRFFTSPNIIFGCVLVATIIFCWKNFHR